MHRGANAARNDPVSIELDLVQPSGAGRRANDGNGRQDETVGIGPVPREPRFGFMCHRGPSAMRWMSASLHVSEEGIAPSVPSNVFDARWNRRCPDRERLWVVSRQQPPSVTKWFRTFLAIRVTSDRRFVKILHNPFAEGGERGW
jgi:hypothetical protein